MASENNYVQPAIPRFDGHYDHWSMLMENFLRSKEYWSLVEQGINEPTVGSVLTDAQTKILEDQKLKDLKAKNYLFQAIDRGILETILHKNTSKQIWDSMKKKYQGSTRVKRAQLQTLRKEFEILHMNTGESVDGYFSRTLAIANRMRIHGDKMEDVTIIEKILRSMSAKFNYVVCSIEESHNIEELLIDKLQSSLLLHEQRMVSIIPEEQVLKVSMNGGVLSRGYGRGRSWGRGGTGRGGRGRGYDQKPFDKSRVQCYNCHRYGHYQYECTDKEEKVNLVEAEAEEEMLFNGIS
ncbi:uncharacterized protein [Populus alba]|uniref:uncharacterized protein n=1 Tax=Populus alba TaxID=43335 RepID=UPI003CC79559